MNIPRVTDEESQKDASSSFTRRAILAGLIMAFSSIFPIRTTACESVPPARCLWCRRFSGLSASSSYRDIFTFRFLPRNTFCPSVSQTATGCMPVTAGFINVIPALEFLISLEENEPLRQNTTNLIFWSIGLCFFGLIFAAVFREHFVVREKLPWPGARGTANLINTLHHRNQKPDTGESSAKNDGNGLGEDEETDQSNTARDEQALLTPQPTVDGFRWERGMQSLLRGSLLSWGL
ncbi:OPT oligopeptide transporter protein-domain-containing protein [Triangularia setosa]|uniref:OPT oligopeptide transporter protein-domain-containing protein n=1 Tax=Triangularia setosa TaxID=2587417 RepID=A0AAN6WFI3_9PEZI|nr:OPT oligopeptide transporter protein-domain-containing protein [Podospora setosa]